MTVGSLVPIQQRTPEWLAFRQDKITATDAAIIAGEVGSIVDLWAQKRGILEPPEFDEQTLELMEEGLAIQPYLLDYYQRKTGRRVRAIHTMRQRKDWPIAVSSPDGEVIGERRGIEAKMTTSSDWASASRRGEAVPGKVFAQVQWQAYTAGWDQVDVVVLLYGRPKIIEIGFDPGYVDNLVWLAKEFHGWVTEGVRPPMDGSENARRVLSKLHPRNDGTFIPPTPDIDRVFFDWMAAKVVLDHATNEVDTFGNTLRALIGDADGIDGRVTWRKNADSTRMDWPTVAKEYRTVIEAARTLHPETIDALLSDGYGTTRLEDVESLHSRTIEGPRVLRSVWKGEPE